MTYEVYVRIGRGATLHEWTFTQDPTRAKVADGLTVLSGMTFGWAQPKGGVWPRQPDLMQASFTLSAPTLAELGVTEIPDGDPVVIEVKQDVAGSVVASFYGDVASYKVKARRRKAGGVYVSVVAVDPIARLAEETVLLPTPSPLTDLTMAEVLWTDTLFSGGQEMLGNAGIVAGPPAGGVWWTAENALQSVPTNRTKVTDYVGHLLDQSVMDSGQLRMILSPVIAPDGTMVSNAPGATWVPASGRLFTLDYVSSDASTDDLTAWELPAKACRTDSLGWSNVKGDSVGYVQAVGWAADPANVATAANPNAPARATAETVPLDFDGSVASATFAQNVADFYANAASQFDPWRLDTITVEVSRATDNGVPLVVPEALFPQWKLAEGDDQRARCYWRRVNITGLDTTLTPDGTDQLRGLLVGATCVVAGGQLRLELQLRRIRADVAAPPPAVTLTIPAAQVTSPLPGFVTRVNLADIALGSWWDTVAADGSNIRVLAGSTELPVDLARFNRGAHTGELFFRGSLAAGVDNVFTITADPADPPVAATDPTGRNAVWADYDLVHIPSADYANGGGLVNRTGGATPAVVPATLAPTLTASGWNWVAGTTGHVDTTVPLRTSWTLRARARQTVSDGSIHAIASYGTGIDDTKRATLVARANTSNNFNHWNSSDGYLAAAGAANSQSTNLNAWRTWHIDQNGTAQRTISGGGTVAATGAPATQRPGAPGDTVFIGAEDSSNSQPWRGDIDYVYLRPGILPAGWAAAEVTSWHGSGFYTIS